MEETIILSRPEVQRMEGVSPGRFRLPSGRGQRQYRPLGPSDDRYPSRFASTLVCPSKGLGAAAPGRGLDGLAGRRPTGSSRPHPTARALEGLETP